MFNALLQATIRSSGRAASSRISSPFAGSPEGSPLLTNGATFQISYQGGTDNNDVVLTRLALPFLGLSKSLDPRLVKFGATLTVTLVLTKTYAASGRVIYLTS